MKGGGKYERKEGDMKEGSRASLLLLLSFPRKRESIFAWQGGWLAHKQSGDYASLGLYPMRSSTLVIRFFIGPSASARAVASGSTAGLPIFRRISVAD